MSVMIDVLNSESVMCSFCGDFKMVDASYIRGWEDCLEAISVIFNQTKNYDDFKKKIDQLCELVHENKFEKIRVELGVFDIF